MCGCKNMWMNEFLQMNEFLHMIHQFPDFGRSEATGVWRGHRYFLYSRTGAGFINDFTESIHSHTVGLKTPAIANLSPYRSVQ